MADLPDEIHDRVAGQYPVDTPDEAALVGGPAQVERGMEPPDEAKHGRAWDGAIGARFQPRRAAVIHDPYRKVGAALLLLFVIACGVVGPAAIPFGATFLVIFWVQAFYRQTNRVLRGGSDVRAEVSASPEGLAINGRLRAPSSALQAGFVISDELRGPSVLLERKLWWPLLLRMDTVRDARNLLRALGLDASQKVITRRALCGTLTVGVDGIACSGLGKRDFFFPSTAVKDVSTYRAAGVAVASRGGGSQYGINPGLGISDQWGVDLVLHDGRSVRIPVTKGENDPLPRLLEERIRECIELSRGDQAPDDAMGALRRRGRPVEVWLESLRAIGAGANADHRTAPVPTDKLWDIVESVSSDPGDRVAAAVTLRASATDGNRDRLRILVQTTSSPRMRVALAAAVEQDEEALAESLAAIDDVAQARISS